MNYATELQVALEAARRASQRILELYATFEAIPDAQIDISTQADTDAQEIILQTLRQQFPHDAYQAEEATPTLAACERRGWRVWVIDPIDGTRGFAQKTGEFSVMIALTVDGSPVVGVVWEPTLQRCTYASLGQGCFTESGTRCQATQVASLEQATLVLSHTRPDRPSPLLNALQPCRVVQTHSAGVKLARVARGEADLYVNYYGHFNDWDIAAGHILVTEAGGIVSGLKGQAISYGQGAQKVGLLASNPLLHTPATQRLREVF
ncbi:MAG: 3'(2'),5'-bisphosphate nucleotidase CysQ [Gemmataceae bacterium]